MACHYRTASYDFFRYQGKIKSATESSLAKRKDKFALESLARKSPNEEYAIRLIFANFFMAKNRSIWPGSINKEDLAEVSAFWTAAAYKFEDLYRKYCYQYGMIPGISTAIKDTNNKEFAMFFHILNIVSNGAVYKKCDSKFADNLFWADFSSKYDKDKEFFSTYFPMSESDIQKIRTKLLDIEREKKIYADQNVESA